METSQPGRDELAVNPTTVIEPPTPINIERGDDYTPGSNVLEVEKAPLHFDNLDF